MNDDDLGGGPPGSYHLSLDLPLIVIRVPDDHLYLMRAMESGPFQMGKAADEARSDGESSPVTEDRSPAIPPGPRSG